MNDVVATERIWERVPIPKSRRTRQVLRYRAGAIIPADRVASLNVRPDGTQESVPMAEAASTSAVPLNAPTMPRRAVGTHRRS